MRETKRLDVVTLMAVSGLLKLEYQKKPFPGKD
jgi:hypothetical protein